MSLPRHTLPRRVVHPLTGVSLQNGFTVRRSDLLDKGDILDSQTSASLNPGDVRHPDDPVGGEPQQNGRGTLSDKRMKGSIDDVPFFVRNHVEDSIRNHHRGCWCGEHHRKVRIRTKRMYAGPGWALVYAIGHRERRP
jgi:hypothetical protein